MLAVLPKRSSDDVSGELFVAAYQRKLAHYPNEAISYLADKAIGQCQWFPTIFECNQILSDWRRDDIHTQRQVFASQIANMERRARDAEQWELKRLDKFEITQEQIDAMPESAREFCASIGQIEKAEDGLFVPCKRDIGTPWGPESGVNIDDAAF